MCAVWWRACQSFRVNICTARSSAVPTAGAWKRPMGKRGSCGSKFESDTQPAYRPAAAVVALRGSEAGLGGLVVVMVMVMAGRRGSKCRTGTHGGEQGQKNHFLHARHGSTIRQRVAGRRRCSNPGSQYVSQAPVNRTPRRSAHIARRRGRSGANGSVESSSRCKNYMVSGAPGALIPARAIARMLS